MSTVALLGSLALCSGWSARVHPHRASKPRATVPYASPLFPPALDALCKAAREAALSDSEDPASPGGWCVPCGGSDGEAAVESRARGTYSHCVHHIAPPSTLAPSPLPPPKLSLALRGSNPPVRGLPQAGWGALPATAARHFRHTSGSSHIPLTTLPFNYNRQRGASRLPPASLGDWGGECAPPPPPRRACRLHPSLSRLTLPTMMLSSRYSND